MTEVTPTIRVRACIAIIQDGKILMTPHYLPNERIEWHMPGGRVHYDETVRQAAERELTEETGYIGVAGELIDLFEVFRPEEKYHGIGLTFLGEITGGELHAEVHPVYGRKEARWLSKEDLATLDYNQKHLVDRLMGLS